MLPDKRNLRKCLESYREPPKAVLSYYRDKNDVSEYAVIGKALSADGKCVYGVDRRRSSYTRQMVSSVMLYAARIQGRIA